MTREIDCLLLGTGTSGALPSVACLTSAERGCHCCRSTLEGSTDPLGRKNVRRNTSAVLRIRDSATQAAEEKTILIDCGKTFYSGAVEWWPKKNLRQIDALILTHAHADAILGLDDLRGWTLRGAIQRSIPIYLTQATFEEVSKAFPYLTNAGKVTGGGDVPALTWHIFDEDKPFEVAGIEVVPLPVHHGKFFTTSPTPFYCLGFLFDRQLAYLSDVSYIPEVIYDRIASYVSIPAAAAVQPAAPNGTTVANGNANGKQELPRLKALIVDCLRVEPFASHFGIGQAVETARKLGAERNYLVGFGHRTSHRLWLALTRSLSLPPASLPALPSHLTIDPAVPTPRPAHDWQYYSGHSDPTREDEDEFVLHARWATESWLAAAAAAAPEVDGAKDANGARRQADEAVWIRPAVDGMTIRFGGDRETGDDEYEQE
ncbi:hypothetical protein BMF94_4892 [Rhodotorula taiwanensis]|uniref:Metallo-beta-lactamase domain-containing protein n=1 Tax=Rhodotorula taiwanensis TaxID=741276 RepID=A0A2S5B5S1_9BASI|nr:hypothetical protein BMF94_4892 [Rhodotorula taiwanensis]